MSTESLIDQFAPYPRDLEDVTADKLLKSLLVAGQLTWLRNWALLDESMAERAKAGMAGPKTAEWTQAIQTWVAQYSTIKLLRRLIAAAPKEAEETVSDLWEDWEDGSSQGEFLWEWLVEAGLDPDAIDAAWRERRQPTAADVAAAALQPDSLADPDADRQAELAEDARRDAAEEGAQR